MREVYGYIPALAMVGLQCIYTGLALFTRAALVQGMSPRVFVVYRQAVATLIMAPIAYFTRKNPYRTKLGLRSFALIFVTSLIGVTANQNAYFEGLYLSSSTITTAMTNLIPAVTFVMATLVGLEKIEGGSLRSIAKIVGTVVCVGGAICMALVKGPKLLNTQLLHTTKPLLFGLGVGENLEMGCLILFISCCCWSFWMIMQVPILASCPDHLYSTLWMCFLTTFQSSIFTLFVEDNLQVWRLNSVIEIGSCLYGGIGTAVSFFVQAWCISQRGPLYVAMFNPLCTVITAIVASLFVHEKLFLGSLVGAFAVIIGLYVVLWGKAKDHEVRSDTLMRKTDKSSTKQMFINQCSEKSIIIATDLEEPLVSDRLSYGN